MTSYVSLAGQFLGPLLQLRKNCFLINENVEKKKNKKSD